MAQPRRGLLDRWKDWTEQKRSWILYGAGVLTLFGLVAGWSLLPDQVVLWGGAQGELAAPLDKKTALGATAALVAFFAILFARKPRELVYFIALCIGVVLVYSLILGNVTL